VIADPLRRLAPVVRLAPAKLNLTLAIVGRRTDGFHALHSVIVPLALSDRLSLAPGGTEEDSLNCTGFPCGPDPENLVTRAIAAVRTAVGRADPTPALAVRLDKRIPVAAGLGGGSSDAAAAIHGSLEAWGAELVPGAYLEVAASIGSDVPFFLAPRATLVEGRGERLTPLHGVRDGAPAVVLVTPTVAASTRDVFAAWAAGAMSEPGVARRTSEHFASEFGSGLSTGAFVERAGVLASANDLLPAAEVVVPGLLAFRRRLMRIISRPIGLNGSGPTLWALYPSLDEAEGIAARIRAAVAAGEVDAPGEEAPFVTATEILRDPPDAHKAPDPRQPTDVHLPAEKGSPSP
jgi:4-diphosphocytidyl-2-C-methyl-D-erythritol kinase